MSLSSVSAPNKNHFIKEEDLKLYFKMIDLIQEREYAALYDTLLYEAGSLLVNLIHEEKNDDLLLITVLENDPIAFDIILNFGAKIDIEWLQRLVDKVLKSPKPLSSGINDRIIGLLSHEYQTPSKQEIFERIPKVIEKPQPKKLTFLELEIDLTPVYLENDNLAKACQTLFELPEFAQLIKDSTFHPLKVQFVPKDKLFSLGECDFSRKRVNLAESASFHDKFTTMIFELCNAANKQLHDAYYASYEGHPDENAYALCMEQSEYLSTVKYKEMLCKITNNKKIMATLENCGISQEYLEDTALSYDMDFASYWKMVNKVSKDKEYSDKGYSHAEYYRRGYRQWKHFQALLKPLNVGAKVEKTNKATSDSNKENSHKHNLEAKQKKVVPVQVTPTAQTKPTLRSVKPLRKINLNVQDILSGSMAIILGGGILLNASTFPMIGLGVFIVGFGVANSLHNLYKANAVTTAPSAIIHRSTATEQSQHDLANAKPILNQFGNTKTASVTSKASQTNAVVNEFKARFN